MWLIIATFFTFAQAKGTTFDFATTHMGSTPPISAIGDQAERRAGLTFGWPSGVVADYAAPIGRGPLAWEAQVHAGGLHGGAMAALWLHGGADTHNGLHTGLRLAAAYRNGTEYLPELAGLPPGAAYGPYTSAIGQLAWGRGDRGAVSLSLGLSASMEVYRVPSMASMSSDGEQATVGDGGQLRFDPVLGPLADLHVEIPAGERRTVFFGVGVPSGVTAGMRF